MLTNHDTLQRAMLQFTKMELGIEVKGKPGLNSQLSPSSQLSPVSSLSSSSTNTTPETGGKEPGSSPGRPTSANNTTPARSPPKGRSLASTKAKSLRDNALKHSRQGWYIFVMYEFLFKHFYKKYFKELV